MHGPFVPGGQEHADREGWADAIGKIAGGEHSRVFLRPLPCEGQHDTSCGEIASAQCGQPAPAKRALGFTRPCRWPKCDWKKTQKLNEFVIRSAYMHVHDEKLSHPVMHEEC